MIAFILANWKSVLACAATFALCLMLHKLDVNRIESNHASEILKVKTALTAECVAAQAITEKVSHDYQKNIASLGARLAAAHRLHDNACLSVEVEAASRSDGAAASGKPSGSSVTGTGRISAGTFIDLIGEGEKYRLQVMACQAFLTATDGR